MVDNKSTIKENAFLNQRTKGEKILLSELLTYPPSDIVLLQLFPYSRGRQPYITQSGLAIMKLRLEGLTAKEIGEKLNLTLAQVNGRFQVTKNRLMRAILPDYIEIDVPGVRRLRGMDIPITSGYKKVSELLRDMPSDQELLDFAITRGHIPGITERRTLSHSDLLLLQRKADGCRDADIAREQGVTQNNIHHRLVWIRCMLRQRLGIQIDMPELFSYEVDRDSVDQSED